jgi:hypothetical protein
MPECVVRGKSFQEDEKGFAFLHGKHRRYCSRKCLQTAHIIRKYGSFSGLYKAKFGFWGKPTLPEKEVIFKSEELAAKHILPNEGFNDIFWYSELYPSAFTDVLAKKDGRVWSINVTTCHTKSVNKRPTVELSRYLGLNRIILFIKPDLSAYCLREVKPGQKALVVHKDAVLIPISTNPRFGPVVGRPLR